MTSNNGHIWSSMDTDTDMDTVQYYTRAVFSTRPSVLHFSTMRVAHRPKKRSTENVCAEIAVEVRLRCV